MVKALSVSEVIDRQAKVYAAAASLPRWTPDSATPARLVRHLRPPPANCILVVGLLQPARRPARWGAQASTW